MANLTDYDRAILRRLRQGPATAHEAACARWDAGDTEPKVAYEHGPHGPDGVSGPIAAGVTGHVTYSGFGLGTYRITREAVAIADEALADPVVVECVKGGGRG